MADIVTGMHSLQSEMSSVHRLPSLAALLFLHCDTTIRRLDMLEQHKNTSLNCNLSSQFTTFTGAYVTL